MPWQPRQQTLVLPTGYIGQCHVSGKSRQPVQYVVHHPLGVQCVFSLQSLSVPAHNGKLMEKGEDVGCSGYVDPASYCQYGLKQNG